MFIIIEVLLTVMLCVILPQLMYIALVGFTGYVLCKTMKRKTIGQMIILLCIFTSLNLIISKAKPLIDSANQTKSKIESIDKESKSNTKKIWDFLNKYPNEKSDE
jgi:Na+/phosphate symporter